MVNRNFIRIGIILLFLMLSIYFVQHPIFEKTDLSKYEGETRPFYFTEIAQKSEGGYTVLIGLEKQQIEVITDDHFDAEEIVSFYGTVNNNRLIVQRHHRHEYPGRSYYLSFVGLLGFLYLMMREGD